MNFPSYSRNRVLFLFVLLCVCTSSQTEEKMLLVKNNFYSLSVPKDWEAYNKSDGNIPQKRVGDIYDLYYLTWTTKVRSEKDLANTILLTIDTYKRKDKKDISIDEIVKLEIELLSTSKILMLKEEKIDKRHRKFFLKRSINEMGVLREYIHSYLYVHSNDVVHKVCLMMRAGCYDLPTTKKTIRSVLNSFLPV